MLSPPSVFLIIPRGRKDCQTQPKRLYLQIGVCRVALYSLRGHTDADGCASGGSISWPARNGGKNRAKGVPPLRFSHARGKLCKIERSTETLVCGRLATGSKYARPPLRGGSPRTESLAAAIGIQPVSFPRSGCRLRRDGESPLSVSPETEWMLSHSRSRSQAATTFFLSSARRYTKLRHAGGIPKGGALRRVFCPALFCTSRKGLAVGDKNSSTNSNLYYITSPSK